MSVGTQVLPLCSFSPWLIPCSSSCLVPAEQAHGLAFLLPQPGWTAARAPEFLHPSPSVSHLGSSLAVGTGYFQVHCIKMVCERLASSVALNLIISPPILIGMTQRTNLAMRLKSAPREPAVARLDASTCRRQ